MSIVSGVATAPGVSPLLNAPRDTNGELRAAAGEPATDPKTHKTENAPPVSGGRTTERPVAAAAHAQSMARADRQRAPSDSRLVRFADAVRALRLDDEARDLTPERIAELREAGREVFMLDDGVPGEVRPPAPDTKPAGPDGADRARKEPAEDAKPAAILDAPGGDPEGPEKGPAASTASGEPARPEKAQSGPDTAADPRPSIERSGSGDATGVPEAGTGERRAADTSAGHSPDGRD